MKYFQRRIREIVRMQHERAFSTPYEAGMDCALNGANLGNCHFTYFMTPELTAEWTRGRDNNATLSDGAES